MLYYICKTNGAIRIAPIAVLESEGKYMDAKLVEVSVDKFVDAVNTVISRTSNIILANGLDLIEMDMSQYSPFTFFISEMTVERGAVWIVKDTELKKELFKFCMEHEDRVFRGTKGEKNSND